MAATSAQDPFAKLFGSIARVRLLRLILLSQKKTFTAADAAARAHISAAEARKELKLLTEVGIVKCSNGKEKRYGADERFPFLQELQHMLLHAPLRGNDVHARIRGAGVIKLVVLAGVFNGDFSGGGLDVLIVGDRINERRLRSALKTLEADIGAELRYASFPTADFLYRLTVSDRFIRDVFDFPHRILFDKLDIGLK